MGTMKNIVVLFALSLYFVVNLNAQQDSSAMQAETNPDLLVGKCNRAELQNSEFGESFFEAYQKYNPDTETLANIKNKIFNSTITIVLGTWCHDSQDHVPGFIRILDEIDYNTNYLKIICLDKNKLAGDVDISALKIEKVPTFIFYEKNKEVGRIIETPASTLELDTYNILKE
ncbi:MAG: thioredoxin [Candidatus Cloacimonadota bacterium]|nr:MAG: thioredoxin [Candidatus Cloacimonadota bacterium]